MDVEDGDVESDGDYDQAQGSGSKVFDGVEEWFGEISEDGPELPDGEDTDVEDDEEADKLDRDRSSQHRSCDCQPDPPGGGEWFLDCPELRHGEDGSGDEEQEYGI